MILDRAELNAFVAANATTYPQGYGYTELGPLEFASPAQLPEVMRALIGLGYSESAIGAIFGGNFLRVATQVWK